MPDAAEVADVIQQASRAVNRRLNGRRIEQHRQIEGDAQHRGHDGHPLEAVEHRRVLAAPGNRPSAPGNPDHPEAIGEEQEAQGGEARERFDPAVVNPGPDQAFAELLHTEEERGQRQGHVVFLVSAFGDMGRIEPERHQNSRSGEAG